MPTWRQSSSTPPQLQQRPPRFCRGLAHQTYAPAAEATRHVAALHPIYDHRRHVAAPFWRHWRHRHSRVYPLQCTTTFVAHSGSQLRGGGAGGAIVEPMRLEAHAVPTLSSHRSDASRWNTHRAVPAPLVHRGEAPALDGHAAGREPVGRVGEDGVHALWWHEAHQVHTIRP
jgi:hypothetical protein